MTPDKILNILIFFITLPTSLYFSTSIYYTSFCNMDLLYDFTIYLFTLLFFYLISNFYLFKSIFSSQKNISHFLKLLFINIFLILIILKYHKKVDCLLFSIYIIFLSINTIFSIENKQFIFSTVFFAIFINSINFIYNNRIIETKVINQKDLYKKYTDYISDYVEIWYDRYIKRTEVFFNKLKNEYIILTERSANYNKKRNDIIFHIYSFMIKNRYYEKIAHFCNWIDLFLTFAIFISLYIFHRKIDLTERKKNLIFFTQLNFFYTLYLFLRNNILHYYLNDIDMAVDESFLNTKYKFEYYQILNYYMKKNNSLINKTFLSKIYETPAIFLIRYLNYHNKYF